MKACSKCKKPTYEFPITGRGTSSTMCVPCYTWQKKWNADKEVRVKEARQNPPEGMQYCLGCKRLRPIDEFEAFPKQRRRRERGESSPVCLKCRTRRSSYVAQKRRLATAEEKLKTLKERREWMRQWRHKIVTAYGGVCNCCGEDSVEFLQLHHRNNDGHVHRRAIGYNSEALYRWAERNGFPATLEVLCANCHNAESFYGGCPHKKAA